MKNGNAMVVDTNVLIHDPQSIFTLMNDVNTIFIHSSVIMELNSNKSKPDIGKECRDSIKLIEKLQLEDNYRLKIINSTTFDDPGLKHLDIHKTDHKIIALAYNLTKENNKHKKYNKIKLITRDAEMRIHARTLDITVQDYVSDDVVTRIPLTTKHIKILPDIIDGEYQCIDACDIPDHDKIIQNEGIVCEVIQDDIVINKFACIKKGSVFKILDNNINVMGIKPYSMCSDSYNWEQHIALHQLLDDNIKICFLIGASGSGKTLLALASSIYQRKYYRNILVSRPMVSLNDETNMGFLPGMIEEKMAPWIKPIFRILTYLSNINETNKNIISKIREGNKKKLDIEPIDYIRGNTFHRDILIIDEAQNLTPSQIKSIITRCGEGTKMIFTGDLNQIDKRCLNKKSSGLNTASTKMKDNSMVSIINFNETVRSEVVRFAEEVL